LKATPGNYSIDSLPKRAVLETSHIIRKVIQSWCLLVGEIHQWLEGRTTRNNPRDKIIITAAATRYQLNSLNYEGMQNEIKRICNVKVRLRPIIIGAAGSLSRSFQKAVTLYRRRRPFWKLHTSCRR
jgi:hypothetical protein